MAATGGGGGWRALDALVLFAAGVAVGLLLVIVSKRPRPEGGEPE